MIIEIQSSPTYKRVRHRYRCSLPWERIFLLDLSGIAWRLGKLVGEMTDKSKKYILQNTRGILRMMKQAHVSF